MEMRAQWVSALGVQVGAPRPAEGRAGPGDSVACLSLGSSTGSGGGGVADPPQSSEEAEAAWGSERSTSGRGGRAHPPGPFPYRSQEEGVRTGSETQRTGRCGDAQEFK